MRFFSTHISLVNRNTGVRVYRRARARSPFLSVAAHRSDIVASWICELSDMSIDDSQREHLSHCPWKAVFLSRVFFFTSMHQAVLIACLTTPLCQQNF